MLICLETAEMLKTKYKLWGRLYVIIFVYSYFTRYFSEQTERLFNFFLFYFFFFTTELSSA